MKGFIPGFATRKAAASTDGVAVKGELQTMDGKKEREAVLTKMGHEAGRKGLARRQGWPRGDKKRPAKAPEARTNEWMNGRRSLGLQSTHLARI